jgi:MoxR-like ATPase
MCQAIPCSDPKTGEFTTRRGPVFAHLLPADESTAPRLNPGGAIEVMQESQVTIEATAHFADAFACRRPD